MAFKTSYFDWAAGEVNQKQKRDGEKVLKEFGAFFFFFLSHRGVLYLEGFTLVLRFREKRKNKFFFFFFLEGWGGWVYPNKFICPNREGFLYVFITLSAYITELFKDNLFRG